MQHRFRRFSLRFLQFGLALNAILLLGIGLSAWRQDRHLARLAAKDEALTDLSAALHHLEEQLDALPRLASASDLEEWIRRRRTYNGELTSAIEAALPHLPPGPLRTELARSGAAKTELAMREGDALLALREGKADEARELLLSPLYREKAHTHAHLLLRERRAVDELVEGVHRLYGGSVSVFTVLAIGSLSLLLLQGLFLYFFLRHYFARQQESDRALAATNERLRREAQIRERLAREREIYHQAFRHSTQSVCITDPEGTILHVNEAFESLYGYTEAECLGQTPRILNPGRAAYLDLGYPHHEYDKIFRELWTAIRNPEIGFWVGELPNRKRNGEIVWVDLFINAIRDADGGVLGYVGMPINVTLRRERERGIRLECYRALTELAETRDNETGAHLNRIAAYCRLLAETLQLPQKFIEDIVVFSPLHDIGKVGIPDAILTAPRRLSAEEFEIMKTHASLGHEILRHRETLEMAAVIARSHHERYDGNGYPQGLAGADIPLSARLVALADVYDALRTERCYKEAWPHERARTVLVEGRGTQFDPQVVDAFLAREEEFLRISEAGERFAENAGTASPLAPTATAPTEAASGGSFSAMRMPGRGAEAFSAEGGGR